MTMDLSRRAFLRGSLAVASLAVVPVVLKFAPVPLVLWGDGKHNDTEALNALFRRELITIANSDLIQAEAWSGGTLLNNGCFRITGPLSASGLSDLTITNCMFLAGEDFPKGEAMLELGDSERIRIVNNFFGMATEEPAISVAHARNAFITHNVSHGNGWSVRDLIKS